MRLELASINVAPKGGGNSHSGATIFIFQDGRDLEEFVEDFVNHCHLTTCDDLTLMEGFWCGLVEDIRLVMPRADPSWSLKKYINFALWIAGSNFIVGEMESGPQSSHVAAAPQSVPPAIPQLSSASPTGDDSEPVTPAALWPPPSSSPLVPSSSSSSLLVPERRREPALPERRREPALPVRRHEPVPVPVPAPRLRPPVPAPRLRPPVPAPRLRPPPEPAPRQRPPEPAPRQRPPEPALSQRPPVPAPRQRPPVLLLVPSSSPEPLLVPSSSPEPLLVPSSSPEPLLVPSSSPEPRLATTGSPEPLPAPSGSPEPLPATSGSPEPRVTAPPEHPPEKRFPKRILGGGATLHGLPSFLLCHGGIPSSLLRHGGIPSSLLRRGRLSPRIRRGRLSPRIRRGRLSPRIRRGRLSPRIRRGRLSPRIRHVSRNGHRPGGHLSGLLEPWGLQSAHPPSPFDVIRRGTRLLEGGGNVTVCLPLPLSPHPYMVLPVSQSLWVQLVPALCPDYVPGVSS